LLPTGASSASGGNLDQSKGVNSMGGKTDLVKGRVEEATGVLVGNDKLRHKGQTDQVIGRVKQAVKKLIKVTQ